MFVLEVSFINVLFDSIIFISALSSIAVILLLQKFQNVDKIFGYSILLTGLFEIIAKVTLLFDVKNNLPGLHLYTLLDFVVISWFFKFRMDAESGFK